MLQIARKFDTNHQHMLHACFKLTISRFSTLVKEVPEQMVRVLNVAEKNDAAKSLANVLSQGRCRKVISIMLLYNCITLLFDALWCVIPALIVQQDFF